MVVVAVGDVVNSVDVVVDLVVIVSVAVIEVVNSALVCVVVVVGIEVDAVVGSVVPISICGNV